MLKEFLRRIFSVDFFNSTRVVIYILGIRIRFVKPKYKNKVNEVKKKFASITEIPKATGLLRKFQIASLKFLLQIDEICKENNIQYWLDHGNLLGAIRHNGFIPWDDDSDIAMLREDYEKFIQLFKENPNKYPNIYLYFDNNGKNKCFIKIKTKEFEGIAIDVFPYDFYYKKINDEEKIELSNKIRNIQKKGFNRLLFPVLILSKQKMRKLFAEKTKAIINMNNISDRDAKPAIFAAIDYPQRDRNLVYDYETIFPLKQVDFEGFKIFAPNNFDKYLTQKYGDYMQVPNDCYPRHIFYGSTNIEKLDRFISDIDIPC